LAYIIARRFSTITSSTSPRIIAVLVPFALAPRREGDEHGNAVRRQDGREHQPKCRGSGRRRQRLRRGARRLVLLQQLPERDEEEDDAARQKLRQRTKKQKAHTS
jgi:hypothetical protein